ncbi:hypothetical protein BT63DRAFT_457237 [Microthyrium microscopicum]|uniref:NAD(P)-binding protein n=1 Tax=Microthyrium microscopicum TaxID=703497 RepID=A0A6A6U6P8_9PEZI|nr:hypothetical protein BT63DRAFT_457237 [Microthyrium microscopicum]
MPKLSAIQAGIAKLPDDQPIVAAIAGGTTGIGSYIAKELAKVFALKGPKLRVYIIGRNAERAESVLSEGKEISPGSDWRFVEASDLALISEVDRASKEIIRQENEAPLSGGLARLDMLYMTHSYSLFAPRLKTKEGLDAFMSTLYYSRIRFITQLMPLLTSSPSQSHVISVYAGSFEEVKDAEASIGCPSDDDYGIGTVRRNTTYMKNFIFEELANKHAGKVSFVHIYPGLVDGPGFYHPDHPLWWKIVWRLVYPIAWLAYITSPEVCGQVMVNLATERYPAKGNQGGSSDVEMATNGELGGGCYGVGQRGDSGNKKGKSFVKFRPEGITKKAWDHTMDTLDSIERENR